jgi:cytochrome c peroxidase
MSNFSSSTLPFALAFAVVALFALPACNPVNSVNPEPMQKDYLVLATILDAVGQQGYDQLRMPDPEQYDGIPQDPNNPLSVDKVKLGRMLFHETALGTQAREESGTGTYSCASCHHAAAGFQAGVQQGLGDGGVGFGVRGEARVISSDYQQNEIDRQPMRSPTAMNGAFTPVTLWNGQFGAAGPNVGTEANWTDGTPLAVNALGYLGLETQAIAGLTVHRMAPTPEFFEAVPGYLPLFDAAFPDFPVDNRYTVETAGLAIAAYERTIMGYEAPFQQWLRGEHHAMSEQQKDGAIVFFGAGQCATCHNGPGLTDGGFHALGMPDMPGIEALDAGDDTYGLSGADLALGRGGFTGQEGDKHAFKTPQLYNLKDSPFYGHGGTFYSLAEVIQYKVEGVAAKEEASSFLSDDFQSVALTTQQQHDLHEFLKHGLYDAHMDRYVPNSVLSGNCFPNNDPTSCEDLGCDPS